MQELLEEIEAADTDSLFEDSVRDCYPEETKIGWLAHDTALAIKELDPISWDIAKGEWLDQEAQTRIFNFVLLSNSLIFFGAAQNGFSPIG